MVDENELVVFVPEETPAVLAGAKRNVISDAVAKAGSFGRKFSKQDLLPISMVILLVSAKPLLRILPANFYSFLVYPTQLAVSFFSGLDFTFISASTYKDVTSGIVIDKSCAGMTFLLISFVVCSIALRRFRIRHQIRLLPILFVTGFFLTVTANVSRILCSIFLENAPMVLFPAFPQHTAIGIVVYMTFLLSFYVALSFFLSTRKIANEDIS